MSRSSHVTMMGVFRGKTKLEIQRMINERDLDVQLLKQKQQRKREARLEAKKKKALAFISKGL